MKVHGAISFREALCDSDTLSTRARIVGHTLARYMDQAGECYPSLELIADGCGYAKNNGTIRKGLDELVGEGMLAIFPGAGAGTTRKTDRYRSLVTKKGSVREPIK